MKNLTRLTSLIVAIALCLSSLAFTSSAISNTIVPEYTFTEEPSNDNVCAQKAQGDFIYLDSEKTYFANDQVATAIFGLHSDDEILSYNFTPYGVAITSNQLISKKGFIQINFCKLGLSSNASNYATLDLTVLLSSQKTINKTAYFYFGDNGCTISLHSLEDAEHIYYDNLFLTSILTEKQYYDKLNALYDDCIIETFEMSERHREILSKRPQRTETRSGQMVTGEIVWMDKENHPHALRGAKVVLYTTSSSTPVATTYSDSDGIYEFTGLTTIQNKNVYLKVYAGDDNAMVYNAALTAPYFMESRDITAANAETYLNCIIAHRGVLAQAMQISQAVITARDYAWNMMGHSPSNVKVAYPTQDDNCYYNYNSKKIAITSIGINEDIESFESFDVIMHEYGHHLQYQLNITDSPGEEHYSSTNDADLYGQYAGIRLAWGEAWPTVFGMVAQQYFGAYLSDLCYYGPDCPEYGTAEFEEHICYAENAIYEAYNFFTEDFYSLESGCTRLGEACEDSIMAILWDLYDYGTETDDEIGLGSFNFWRITTSGEAKTFSEFIDDFYGFCSSSTFSALNQDDVYKLGKNLVRYKVAGEILYRTGIPHELTIKLNGGSETYGNNYFVLTFYDSNNNAILTNTFTVSDQSTYDHQISEADWNTILSASGSTYSVVLSSYAIHQDNNYNSSTVTVTTGPYHAPSKTYYK
ncbi:MAG: hypothetical protein IJE25_07365 [Clostridia bacterium]|nr:hypothetical protein [Clostridia bacterium]